SDNIGGPVITQIPVAAVEGRVWLDSNHNRTREPGETLLAGWRVDLVSPAGVVVGTAVTDENGFYRITGITPGNGYKLVFRNPSAGTIYGSPVNGETRGTQIPAVGTFNPATFSNANVGSGIIQSIDLLEGVTAVEQSLPIDPTGVVYDSETRQPVAGAQVCVDGPAGFNPATQLVSGLRCVTTGPDGMYQFIFTSFGSGGAPTGSYTISVVPPNGYTAPSSAYLPNGVLTVPGPTSGNLPVQSQSTAPQQGQGTTYYFQLVFGPSSGGVVNNHIPIDPKSSGSVLVSKVASITAAELGDSIQYTIKISNANNIALTGASVRDTLPAGFRYIPGTARVNGAKIADPVGVGPQLQISLPNIPAGGNAELTYFVRLGAGAAQGDGINRAQVFIGARPKSNVASAKVKVTGGVMGTDACIVGKVFLDCDGNHMQNNAPGGNELGIPGVRLVMETGAYAVTDNDGKYSICPVTPHTHVVRVDSRSLPKGAIMVPSSNRNAGDGLSMFADVKSGDLFRAEFIEGSCSAEVINDVKERRKRAEPGGELNRPDQPGVRNTGSMPSGLQPTPRP
ncbi:MAG: SdrD B-like domain-containing protein, partial [Usitatibacteraceae bacterium]